MTEKSAFDWRAFVGHVAVALAIGGIIAYFTDAKWLAASFWVSAAMYLNGSLAVHEDVLPGGFDNPDGENTPAFTKGVGAARFWVSSLAVTIALAAVGFAIQTYS